MRIPRSPKPSDEQPDSLITVRQLLEKSPLYATKELSIPHRIEDAWPYTLELPCSVCGKSRPFSRSSGNEEHRFIGAGVNVSAPRLSTGIYDATYHCGDCHSNPYRFSVHFDCEEAAIQKVGQWPRWDIDIDPTLKKRLGDAELFYRSARIMLAESFGIGACAYLRRALEDLVDPILNLEADIADELGEADDATALRKVQGAQPFDEKAREAYRRAPADLVVDGRNPLKELHKFLSVAVHKLSEEQAVDLAQEHSNDLKFVITRLHTWMEERREFRDSMQQARRPTT